MGNISPISFPVRNLTDFILKEWLLIASGSALFLSSLYLHTYPHYSLDDAEMLFVLFLFFIIVKSLGNSGLMLSMIRRIEHGNGVAIKLVIATFFLSMTITNDAALLIMVPLTLAAHMKNKGTLVILESMTANAGSSLTPFGNPQNLFIYWHYHLTLFDFVSVIAPFSLLMLVIFILFAAHIQPVNNHLPKQPVIISMPPALSSLTMLICLILIVLHILPIWFGIIILLVTVFYDPAAFHVDYGLLGAFFSLFGLAENIQTLIGLQLHATEHVFLLTALTSQIMSNVPATLLVARFTENWQGLLWGASIGGFGGLFGSLANLIAYRLYTLHPETNDHAAFTRQFLLMSYLSFLLCGIIYLLYYWKYT